MSIQSEYHPQSCYFLPCIVLDDMVCECCGEDAGTVLTLAFAFWSLHVFFGNVTGGHEG